MSNGDQFREQVEAYAIGALDVGEREAFEGHLATGCPDCAKALEEARWLVSQLAYLAPEAQPSDMLKGRLMQAVRSDAHGSARSASAKPAIPIWLWAGVAALLVMTLYSAWDQKRLRDQIRATNEAAALEIQKRHDLEAQLALLERQSIILTDPASVKIPLASQDKEKPPLEALWHTKLGIVVTGQKVPMPSGNRTLQLWLIPKEPGSKPVPSMTLRPDADGKFVMLVSSPPELMTRTKALAITEEPAGGSPAPTTTPIWVGGIT